MSYQVVAPLVIAKDQDGRNHHVYEGGIIAWLSDEQAAHFLSSDLVVEIGGSAPAAAITVSDVVVERPLASATKPVLTKWVVENVSKDDGGKYTAAELKSLDKPALWALVDGPEDEDDADEKPLADADTEVLVDWLDAHGEYDRAELEAQSDDQLWELIEATEV